MNIRLTTSLTAEDENTLAPALLTTLTGILDMLPIAYSVRIETNDAQVFQHSGSRREPARIVERSLVAS